MRFAIIGCGRISYKHVQALIDNKDTLTLVALSDLVEERMQDRKKQYQEATGRDVFLYKDYKTLLSREDIEAVAIATESGYHGEIALEALKAGKHVLIEKPMAMTLEEIDAINDYAEAHHLTVGVCHQNRFNKPIQKLRRAIEEGRFGRIINITARILWTRDQNYYDIAPWRGTKALDGGTLMNQCIHNIDLLQWMMNSPLKSVKSERGTFLRDIEMEDFGALLLRFENDSIGLVEGSACVYPKNLEETLSVFGEKGTVVIGGLAVNELKVWNFEDERDYDHEDASSVVENVYGSGHTPLYKDFSEAILEGREPYISGREGRKSVEIVLKSYEDCKRP
ncbi:Gfo/Idh/MocA family protein [Guggenheimella bovis]